ncbi:unnamed protein product [Rotaria magnacalcarata]|nr:unnamed protein product [Rotaria magnacalcarata]
MIGLVRAFHGLTIRLDELVLQHLQINNYVDLCSASTQKINMCRSEFLPRLVDPVESFYLSNHHHAQNQIDQFFKTGFNLSQFTSLKSISLSYIRSPRIMDKI